MKFSTLTNIYMVLVIFTCVFVVITSILSALTMGNTISNQGVRDVSIAMSYTSMTLGVLLASMTGYYFYRHHQKVVNRNRMMEEFLG